MSFTTLKFCWKRSIKGRRSKRFWFILYILIYWQYVLNPTQPPNMFPLDSQIFLRFSFLFPDDNKCKNRHNYDDSDADSWSSFVNEMLLTVPLDKRKRSTRSYTDSIIPIFYLIFPLSMFHILAKLRSHQSRVL